MLISGTPPHKHIAGSSFKGPLKIIKSDGSKVVIADADGNIDAPVTTTNLTTTGNTIIGDTSADTVTVNGTTTALAPLTVGVDDTGHDVQFFGATASAHMLWDESADSLKLAGAATLDIDGVAAGTAAATLTAGDIVLTDGQVVGTTEALTTGSPTLQAYGASTIDSTGGAVTGTLGSGAFIGQLKTIVMIEASNSSTISITNHETSDPEVATFDAVDEAWLGLWTGTEWVTVFATCTFV